MQVTEIKPGVFACLMANETANAGFVVAERGVIVIDTLDKPARARQLAITIEGMIGKPVMFVINTHHHYDHVFGNQVFAAPIIAHHALPDQLAEAAARDLMPVAIAAWVSTHPEDRWLAYELELTYPTLTFEQELTLHLPPQQVVLRHMGGHTPDTLVADLPEQTVLFASDLVFEGRVPFLRHAHIAGTIQALHTLENLGARTIVPGHGALCTLAYVVRLRGYLEAMYDQIGELVDRGWEKGDVIESDLLPKWWTRDRPDLLRANIAQIYDELLEARRPS